jgi:hypothetical protein
VSTLAFAQPLASAQSKKRLKAISAKAFAPAKPRVRSVIG